MGNRRKKNRTDYDDNRHGNAELTHRTAKKDQISRRGLESGDQTRHGTERPIWIPHLAGLPEQQRLVDEHERRSPLAHGPRERGMARTPVTPGTGRQGGSICSGGSRSNQAVLSVLLPALRSRVRAARACGRVGVQYKRRARLRPAVQRDGVRAADARRCASVRKNSSGR